MAAVKSSQVIVGVGHSPGMQRDHNEDALFTLTTILVSDTQTIPFGLYIVADGMGGHEHGERASGVAIRAMARHVVAKLLSPLISLPPSPPEDPIQQVMQDGIQAAHQAILHNAPGGGTTLTALLMLGDQMTIAHVGDSRAYVLPPGQEMQVLTRDHSLVKRLVELGQLTSAEAFDHPQRNVLYRALGQGEPVDAEVITAPLPNSGYLLLCSDGLWGVLPDNVIKKIIFSSDSPSQACQDLVTSANQAGGPDNISVILLQLPG
jgi:serine/threonine protein phosphatase PrpC